MTPIPNDIIPTDPMRNAVAIIVAAISLDDLKKCRMRQTLHMDGPRDHKSGWWADIAECVEHPRLRRKTTYTRANRDVTSVWSVDGRNYVDTLDEALAALNGPVLPPNEPQFVALQELHARLSERCATPEADHA